MPTDPFVPSELADLPRQQQNLPPGLATPPGRDWRADRPGDLEGASTTGSLLGRPGPNVGYAYTLAGRARGALTISPLEHDADVVAVIAEIAGKRAALFGRDARERLDRADRQAVRSEAAGHVLEEGPHARDVGVEHDARARHPVGAGVHGGNVDRFECQRHRLDGHVELTSFAQMTHGGGNLAFHSRREPHE